MRAEAFPSDAIKGRFAPSTTGGVHPGTLLAGLLCWLDARSQGGEILLRLEDLDRERTKPGYVEAMERDFAWFGLEFDSVTRQSERSEAHEEAMLGLLRSGRVYACACSRAEIRSAGQAAPDGSFRYPGTCRGARVDEDSWREELRPLRLEIDSVPWVYRDECGLDLSGDAAALFGDPILRRRDGSFAYHFASVVDDAAAGITRVVRGRDLALATLPQVSLQRTMQLPTPAYRHHALFLERSGDKLSKLHGAVDVATLRERYSPEALCGLIASAVGLAREGEECRPSDLVEGFDWSRVATEDVELSFDVEQGLAVVS